MIDLCGQIAYTGFMSRVFAQVPIENYFSPAKTFPDFGTLVAVIVKNALMLAGVACFILLVLGGVGLITGAGGGDTKKLEKGKQTITGAVMGLVIIIASLWIVQIIEYLTGISLLSPVLK